MNRRGFIQISSVALLPILLGVLPLFGKDKPRYTIHVRSNRKFGHLLRETSGMLPTKELITDYIIVGGGIAGVSAALTLKGKEFLLFEAADRLGGSSASDSWKSANYALGAHYELAYPSSFGKEVIELLTNLDVIQYNAASDLHEFVEKKFIIKPNEQEQCFIGEDVLEDILSGAEGEDEFYKTLNPYIGEMPLPTRLIDKKYHELNNISFKEFLTSKISLSKDLENRISYQMLDDWGARIDQVSALAGIHYYTCRPYNLKEVELFSPPQGNSYFIEKMVGQFPSLEALKTDSLVRSVRETSSGVEAEIVNVNGEIMLVRAKGLIYAGQKHALKYVLQSPTDLEFNNTYVPWVVLNFVCRKGIDFGKWQNDVLTEDLQFLGFVNSALQHTRSNDLDVFTAYYCLEESSRAQLVEIENNPDAFVAATIELIEKSTGEVITENIEHVNVNLMGHAMPVAKPGYLSLKDVPQISNNIVCAGVDTGRLPLFYEACDSGIQAANQLISNLESSTDHVVDDQSTIES
ncbi:MAG: NAD(P)-binding protein [Flavobacteriales bacterium]|nr:NAD(P)-binding protein [Flavobacteriales bacterium]